MPNYIEMKGSSTINIDAVLGQARRTIEKMSELKNKENKPNKEENK